MTVLLTGGTGYIGSHTCIELIQAGHRVVIADNLSNSSSLVLDRIAEITHVRPQFYCVDLLDEEALGEIFSAEHIDAVIHFAGYKSVSESVKQPIDYYHNNVTGTLLLCKVMEKYAVKKLVFSSSATVYGDAQHMPITEDCPKGITTNPYGESKAMIERILEDLWISDHSWQITLLRYFNPIGAHRSGKIGEDPRGIPNNLLPYIAQVAVGKRPYVQVFGADYDTPDGTGIRDYIHVTDLALGHVKALEAMDRMQGVQVYNLGTGIGYSVLQVIRAFSKACGREVPYVVCPRRSGDVAICCADPTKAKQMLGWTATRSLEEMCEDSWRWQSQNPQGYTDASETASS